MCGIAGFNWEDRALIKLMASFISHRGPDDEGFYVDKGISLGHRRLSIIDLSKRGRQPMENEDGTIQIVFNGEIYNHLEIRQELIKKGHSFNSDCDTEVIIHGYEEYGDLIFSMLEGMFALGIYDKIKKEIILARDKFGEKPLYYFFDKKRFIFASEIKAILLCEDVKRIINFQCLSDYLNLRYSPGDITMFKGIKKVNSGSILRLSKNKIKSKKYFRHKAYDTINPSNEKIDSLISKSVESRLVSDVPVGVFLSGGLDSSTIVSYMSKFKKNIKTFSVGFNEVNDENKYADLVSEYYQTDHKNIFLKVDSLNNLPKIIWHFDEPMADPAALPTYLLSREVSKKVKVVLSGEGGDEVFGGYGTYNYIPKIYSFNRIPKIVRKNLIAPIILSCSGLFKYPKKQIISLGAEIIKKSEDINESYKKLHYFPFDKESRRKIILNQESIQIKNDVIDKYINKNKDLYNASDDYYFSEWLPNDLLMKVDKMSMAHALEVRAPFLSSNLVGYFRAMDYKHKLNRRAFREAVKSKLPEKILKRKKQGFTLPLSIWFGKKDFMERINPHLNDLKKRKIFNIKEYDKLIRKPNEFRSDHKIWVLLNFEIWNKIFLDHVPLTSIKL